jgi:hypothetical protein
MAKVVQELFQVGKHVNNGDPLKIIVLLTENVWYIIDVNHTPGFRHKFLIT